MLATVAAGVVGDASDGAKLGARGYAGRRRRAAAQL
jgi:hypothetical protein